MTPRPLRFARKQRLARKKDFERVFARRCSTADANLVIYADANRLAHSRLGLAVSRRLGRATVRNRIKRRIREAFRTNQYDLPTGLDLICIPRPGPPRKTDQYADTLRRLIPILRKRLVPATPPRNANQA